MPPQLQQERLQAPSAEVFFSTVRSITRLKQGQGTVDCQVWVSKPPEIREKLNTTIKGILTSKGYNPTVRVLNAFKPGLCRILDLDLPILLEKKPSRVQIHYHPFEGPDNGLELKHRWLHELFPVAEILANALSIPEDAVLLSMEKDQQEIYGVTAFDDQGNLVFQDRFSPFFHTFDYMASCPDLGTVSPVCSGITLRQKGQLLLNQAVPTDRDRFWKQFQTIFVPDLIRAMEARVQSNDLEGLEPFFESPEPFFETIDVDVRIDESNYRLGFMDEQISPMEKLHEDIYFFLLNLFEQFSITHKLPESLKLGQILPRVHSVADPRGPWAIIRALPSRKTTRLPGDADIPAIAFDTLVMDATDWILSGSLPCPSGNSQRHSREIPPTDRSLENSCKNRDNRFSLKLHPPNPESDLVYFKEIPGPVPDDLLLKAKTVACHLARLNKMPHIRVWEIATSLQGRPIYAVEAFRVQGRRVSIPRLRLKKPTVLFNARHHANEISSTNAALKFIEFLGTNPGESCLEAASAVFIPLENVDGVATFEALYVDGSCDILHGARYNALGAEFYNEYFKHTPAFPEALAKQRLWHRWLPQLMADLHGVPGHEWCQPYAGYLPKGFREFWIPRAFVYVHLPFLEDPAHPLYAKAMDLAEQMRRAVAEDKDIMDSNQRITALYQKYAWLPEPEVFPKADSTELTALPLLGRARNFNFAVQYPDITRSEVIVEVPDEVAHGKTLGLCVSAHYQIQRTLMQALNPHNSEMIESWDPESCCMKFELQGIPDQEPTKEIK